MWKDILKPTRKASKKLDEKSKFKQEDGPSFLERLFPSLKSRKTFSTLLFELVKQTWLSKKMEIGTIWFLSTKHLSVPKVKKTAHEKKLSQLFFGYKISHPHYTWCKAPLSTPGCCCCCCWMIWICCGCCWWMLNPPIGCWPLEVVQLLLELVTAGVVPISCCCCCWVGWKLLFITAHV